MKFKILICLLAIIAQFSSPNTLISKNANSINLDYGNNYFGSTVNVGYNSNIHDNFWLGIAYSSGAMSYEQDPNTVKLFVEYKGTETLNVNLIINHFLDLTCTYRLESEKQFSFFNSYTLGFSHYYITLQERLTKKDNILDFEISNQYYGEKDFVGYALFLGLNAVEFAPDGRDNMIFAFGAKCHLAFVDLPQSIVISNGIDYDRLTLLSKSGKENSKFMIPYAELFVKFSYLF